MLFVRYGVGVFVYALNDLGNLPKGDCVCSVRYYDLFALKSSIDVLVHVITRLNTIANIRG